METERRTVAKTTLSIGPQLAWRFWSIGPSPERDRRGRHPREEGTMRRIRRLHRTLVVLAVGLLALAAPLVAYADGGPTGG